MKPARTPLSLSPRHGQLIAAWANGDSNWLIAEDLGLSHHTIVAHSDRLFRFLDVHTQARAVAVAIEQGIIHRPGKAWVPRDKWWV